MHTEKTAVVATEKWFQVEYFRFRPEDFADNFHLVCVPLVRPSGLRAGCGARRVRPRSLFSPIFLSFLPMDTDLNMPDRTAIALKGSIGYRHVR
jgi:hypothetical protein